MCAYLELQIAYLEEEPHKDSGEPRPYSAIIDIHLEFNLQTGWRNWLWLRDVSDLVQHSLLAFRWSQHIPRHAMLLYVRFSFWTLYLIYLWVSILALCTAPFSFNVTCACVEMSDSGFLRWMHGNSRSLNNPWIGYCRLSRTTITGYKKKEAIG